MGPAPAAERASEWPLWGGTARLVVRPADAARVTARGSAADLKAARAAVDAVVMAVDTACSRFRPDSEVCLLAAGGGKRRPASPLLAAVVAAALRAAELTDGAVDPTLGSALVAAGYDRDLADLADLADRADLADLADRAGAAPPVLRRGASWRDVELDEAAGTVRTPAGVLLDLGATGKAMAADLAAERAAEAIGCPVLVSLCGDIAVRGTFAGEPWIVQVLERPHDANGPMVEIRDGGLATSTTRARRWRQSGRPMHHLLDPATGLPVRETWRTVTAAAATCVDANTATTGTVVKGAAGLPWLETTGLPARLVAADGSVRGVNGWPAEALAAAS